MLRRTFLQSATGAAAAMRPSAALAHGALGYCTYSLRDLKWRASQFVEYAAKLALDTVQISVLDEYESTDPLHLQELKHHADRLGVAIESGLGCICPTSSLWHPGNGEPCEYVIRGLRTAKMVGARSMRCYVGNAAERRGALPIQRHLEATLQVLRSVRTQAQEFGVKIAIENHNGDMRARELRTLIEEAGRDFVGVCLDTGNPVSLLEDPLLTLEILGPYVATTHIKDIAICEHPRGAAYQEVALGDGCIDLAALVSGIRKFAPQAPLQLEVVTGGGPTVLPYLEPEFWRIFPDLLGSDFARFLALVKRGRCYSGPMLLTGPGEQVAALKRQEMIDLERSVVYAKKTLNVGNRWRA